MIVKESEVGNSEGERVGNSEEGEGDIGCFLKRFSINAKKNCKKK